MDPALKASVMYAKLDRFCFVTKSVFLTELVHITERLESLYNELA